MIQDARDKVSYNIASKVKAAGLGVLISFFACFLHQRSFFLKTVVIYLNVRFYNTFVHDDGTHLNGSCLVNEASLFIVREQKRAFIEENFSSIYI